MRAHTQTHTHNYTRTHTFTHFTWPLKRGPSSVQIFQGKSFRCLLNYSVALLTYGPVSAGGVGAGVGFEASLIFWVAAPALRASVLIVAALG